ncbi:hypothetical protein LOD99_13812 [Oopsacas minuta]|uniref:G-protein coupled receptors family 1 profile domain-containing protein n=1 Tax=Oopsacas minuta TaxID=111878 RepID=A0AAV7KJZ7_9METZ|nr:hypothetical protein LOD99_13812 [Oopsacas minuta]
MAYIVIDSLIKRRAKLKRLRKEGTTTLNISQIRNEQTSYTRDRIVLAIIVFEIMMRVFCMVNIIILDSLQHQNNNITTINNNTGRMKDNCTLVAGTSLYRVFTRGYGYNIVITIFISSNLFVISLLCFLNLFLINIYRNDKRKKYLYGYLAFSIITCTLILILNPIIETYLISQTIYIVCFTIDYFLLIYLTLKLYKIIKKRYTELIFHGNEEELQHKGKERRNIRIFRLFTRVLLISYGFHVLGQNLETIIVSLIGSVLENQCWFRLTYGITYEIEFLRKPYEMSGIASVYVQFMLGTLFNIGLLLSYLGYAFIVQRERRRRVFRYHIERRSIREPLLKDS